MSGEREAFLTAITAAPDDDTPRLVFADWLDENGTEEDRARAALIRAQCQLEHLQPGPERRKLDGEARAILKKYEKGWTKDLRAAKLGTDWTFRRGFLDGGSMSPTRFIQRGDELFRLAPTLRTLKFPNAANEVTELAGSPFLERLVSVDLTYMCTCGWCAIDEELRDLFKSKHATNLRCLSVARDRMEGDGAAALARSKVLANLTELDLSDNPLGGDGLAALAKAKHLGKLTTLNLSGTCTVPTTAELTGFCAFAASKHFPALKRLVLKGNAVNAAGVEALIEGPFFPQLTHLDLSHNRIGQRGARALAHVAADSNLESLDLRGTELGPRAVKALKNAFGKRVKLS